MRRLTETLLILLLVPGLSLAKSAQNNWENLKELAPGQEIRIVLTDAKSYGGEFRGVSDGAITVRVAAGEQTFERKNVLRVSAIGPSHRLRNALIAAGAGVGVGLGIGAAYAASQRREYPQNHYFEGYGLPLGAVFGGAGAGLAAGLSKPGWYDVYRER
jgi:hypothetical protein